MQCFQTATRFFDKLQFEKDKFQNSGDQQSLTGRHHSQVSDPEGRLFKIANDEADFRKTLNRAAYGMLGFTLLFSQ